MRTLNVHSVSPPPEEFVENHPQVPVSQVQHPQPVYPTQTLGQFSNNRPVSVLFVHRNGLVFKKMYSCDIMCVVGNGLFRII